ncbi:2,3-diphosphoglycerate-dependent phosphoglycerate mutase [Enterobacteriaceae endosymbiont of Macroplea appendiculata]|uniref:2,3-diphosphoglycerate-dependent phosphoglycerate mutase n=1 Tax=Enterobacteriaceae endosymbiont of Macroplea appendiculata TaxID=2675790 RepID=UPI00144997CA|nr:2,3-diphosphoglycerate-dependent phosphoglycerate mutase [Enterobacteriaceae endosymbiont of Macroplea appendiculata]QJC30689.1 2,3-diphosphoglycerate-dependent phosphoglycerate mutase [Enterobacteriaceae endosymbiont of Macroplea appendiculata]
MSTIKVVLLRHGQSTWNKENLFTGWHDVSLSEEGKIEAIDAGKILKNYNFLFDYAYTSVLQRAICTLWYILKELNQLWIPVTKSWRLNERHYGALQGMNKLQVTQKYGEKQVTLWRRSYQINPPALTIDDPRCPRYDAKYSHLEDYELPLTESLSITLKRVVYFWENNIFPKIKNGERVIIVAHGNSLRALIKHIEKINDDDIINLNIPTGIPMICEFNHKMKFIKRFYLNNI